VVVVISGRGSNMRNLIEDSHAADAPYQVVAVVSDQPAAPGLLTAQTLGVATHVVAKDRTVDRVTYDRGLAQVIDGYAPDLIVLAGFMRILSPEFVDRHAGRIVNIHPSLLPKYPGLHTHARVLAAHETEHGATVHFVSAELDGGPPIVQGRVPVFAEDDIDSLAARVYGAEHRIYPLAVRWFGAGRLQYREDRAWLDGQPLVAPIAVEVA
jgi:phosphoribosylglycinamide formyltransferase-1